MSTEVIARLKLKAVIARVNSVFNADTPFDNVRVALIKLRKVLRAFESRLNLASSLNDQDATASIIITLNQKILHILPIIGFILRSTNVRNAFELLDPLQNLAQRCISSSARVVLSSEWDYICVPADNR